MRVSPEALAVMCYGLILGCIGLAWVALEPITAAVLTFLLAAVWHDIAVNLSPNKHPQRCIWGKCTKPVSGPRDAEAPSILYCREHAQQAKGKR